VITASKYQINKIPVMESRLLSPHTSEFFQPSVTINSDFYPEKKLLTKLRPIQRLSPLLLFSFILPALFIYMLNAGQVHIGLLQIVFFLFLEINSLFVNFVLWNYFKGKKGIYLWLTEMPIVLLIIFFLI